MYDVGVYELGINCLLPRFAIQFFSCLQFQERLFVYRVLDVALSNTWDSLYGWFPFVKRWVLTSDKYGLSLTLHRAGNAQSVLTARLGRCLDRLLKRD